MNFNSAVLKHRALSRFASALILVPSHSMRFTMLGQRRRAIDWIQPSESLVERAGRYVCDADFLGPMVLSIRQDLRPFTATMLRGFCVSLHRQLSPTDRIDLESMASTPPLN